MFIKKKQFIFYLFACVCLSISGNLFAALTQDPSLNWQTLYTEHFEIHFHDGEEPLANEVASIAEAMHTKLTKKFNWVPRDRTQVVLTDRFDFSNGSATPIPLNTMRLIVSAPAGNSVISDHDNWLELLIEHEYTHILHLDKVSGLPSKLQKVFGRNLFLFPNLLQPPWLLEGLATYTETDKARGIGRGQSSQFRGMMRMEVENGIKPIHQVNQPLVSWPLNTARYLYGVYFYQFLSERSAKNTGDENILELIEQYSNNLMPFAINSNSKRVLGKDMTTLWDEFSAHMHDTFSDEIESIKNAGIVSGAPLTQTGYFTRAPKIADNGDIYYLENDLQSEPQLKVITQGKTNTIANIRGNSFDVHLSAGIVGTEIDAFNDTNQFSDIYHIDLNNNKKTVLTNGKRYLHATWRPDGQQIIAVHNQLGQHAIHLLDIQGNHLDTLWQGTDKTVISSIDSSTDGNQLLMSVWRPDTLWNIELFDISQRKWEKLTHTNAIETGPQFSHNNQSIVFSADYDGVFNIYKLHLTSKKIEKLTNVLGEATSPAIHTTNTADELVYIGLGANGYDLFQLASVTPLSSNKTMTSSTEVKTTNNPTTLAQTNAQNDPQAEIKAKPTEPTEPYNALKRIRPTSWFPYFQFDDVRSEIGLTTFGADPLRRHFYAARLAYDTDNQWAVGRVNYIYDRWNPTLKFSFNREVLAYLDNSGDVERYRNSDTFSAEAVWPFFRHERQWLFHTGIVNETESDEKILSTAGAGATFHERLAGLAISYNSSHHYARSISASNGRQVRLVAEDNEILDSDYTGQIYTLDWRELIDLPGQHVVSARAVAGWGTESPRPYRLGGHDETSVPPTPQSSALALTEDIFDQRSYPLLGYREGRADLRGRRMTLVGVEWRFPIALVERGFMAPPVGLHQLHGKLLYNWGETWDLDKDIPALRRGAGIEFIAEMLLGYRLPMNVRFGYANGFDIGSEEQTYIEAGIPFF